MTHLKGFLAFLAFIGFLLLCGKLFLDLLHWLIRNYPIFSFSTFAILSLGFMYFLMFVPDTPGPRLSRVDREKLERDRELDALRSIDERLRQQNAIAQRDLDLRINRTYDRVNGTYDRPTKKY